MEVRGGNERADGNAGREFALSSLHSIQCQISLIICLSFHYLCSFN